MKNIYYHILFALFLIISVTSCKTETKREVDRIEENPVTDTVKTREETRIADLIQVESPQPNAEIISPLQIKGKARGTWFFEGDFPVRLFDEQGNEIAVAIATAQGEWMTEEWVDFTATMEFEAPASGNGVLVFEKSNPSDMRELDREFRVEVKL